MAEWTKSRFNNEYISGMVTLAIDFANTRELPDFVKGRMSKKRYSKLCYNILKVVYESLKNNNA